MADETKNFLLSFKGDASGALKSLSSLGSGLSAFAGKMNSAGREASNFSSAVMSSVKQAEASAGGLNKVAAAIKQVYGAVGAKAQIAIDDTKLAAAEKHAQALTAAANKFKGAMTGAGIEAENFAQGVMAALEDLADDFTYAGQMAGKFANALTSTAANAFDKLVNVIGTVDLAVSKFVGKVANLGIGNLVGPMLDKLASGFSTASQAVGKFTAALVNVGAKDAFAYLASAAKARLAEIAAGLNNTGQSVTKFISTMANGGAKDMFTGLVESAKAKLVALQSTVAYAILNIKNQLGAVSLNFSNLFQASALGQAVNRIKSVFASVQSQITSGGIQGVMNSALASINNSLNAVKARLSGTLTSGIAAVAPRVAAMAASFSAFAARAVPAIQSVTNSILRIPASLSQTIFQEAAGLTQFTAAVGQALGKMTGMISRWSTDVRSKISSVFGAGGALAEVSSMLKSSGKFILDWNDTIRFAAQGLTNIGRDLMFFVSIPLGVFFTKVINNAIDFQDAMVRVQKTTELSGRELGQLENRLRSLARNTATSHVELAAMASMIGQLGVRGADQIYSLTSVMEMFAQATGLGAERVVEGLSGIAQAFGWNMEKDAESVWKLANVINELENKSGASADAIMTALGKYSQVASIMGITAANAAALSATVKALGFTEDEAGTAIRRMTSQLARHSLEISKVMKNYSEYNSEGKVTEALNKDAVKVFADIATAAGRAGEEGKKVQELMTLMAIADERGGRALAALASNPELLSKNLARANAQWKAANSLQAEYERGLSSTKAQLAMLQNNINDVGMTIGQTLLPVINQFVQILVPAIQMAGEWFRSLSSETQLMAVAAAAALVVLGPALMFFAQILHAVTLIIMSVGKLLVNLGGLFNVFSWLTGVVGSLANAFLSWPVVAAAAAAGVLVVLQKMGVDVAGVFTRLAENARIWGENLARNIASGLVSGAVRFVTRAISFIANMIASFLESHSPPKAGPLRAIDKWGGNLINTFLLGFKNADFSILSDVAGIIEKLLTNGLQDLDLAKALEGVADARVKLSAVISSFNQTGIIDEDLLSKATSGLEDMAETVKALVKYSLQYNKLQERLAQIEKEREAIKSAYDDRIAAVSASGQSVVARINEIRRLQRMRDASLRGMDKEKKALEDQAALLKQMAEFQKNFLDAVTAQRDIFSRIEDILEGMRKKTASGAGSGSKGDDLEAFPGGGGGAGEMSDTMEDIKKKSEEVKKAWEGITNRWNEGRSILQGLIDAWAGVPEKKFNLSVSEGQELTQAEKLYGVLYRVGTIARQVNDTVYGFFQSAKQGWKELTDALTAAAAGPAVPIETLLPPGLINFFTTAVGIISPAAENLKQALGSLKAAFTGFMNAMIALFSKGDVQNGMSSLGQSLGYLLGIIVGGGGAAIINILAGIVNGIAGLLPYAAAFIGAIATNLGPLIGWLQTTLPQVIGVLVFAAAMAGNVFSAVAAAIANTWERISPVFMQARDQLMQAFSPLVNFFQVNGAAIMSVLGALLIGVVGFFTGIVTGIMSGLLFIVTGVTQVLNGIIKIASSVVSFFSSFGSMLWAIITGQFDQVPAYFQGMMQSVYDFLDGILTALIGLFNATVGAVLGTLAGFVKGIYDYFYGLYNDLVGRSIIPDMMEGIKRVIGEGLDFVLGLGKAFVDKFMQFFTDIGTGVTNTLRSLFGLGGGSGQQNGAAQQQVVGAGNATLDGAVPDPAAVLGRISTIQGAVGAFVSFLSQTWANASAALTQTWSSTWSSIQQAAMTVLTTVTGALTVLVTVTFPGLITAVQGAVEEIAKFLESLESMRGQAVQAKAAVDALAASIQGLRDREVTITVRTVYISSGGGTVQGSGSNTLTPSGGGGPVPHGVMNPDEFITVSASSLAGQFRGIMQAREDEYPAGGITINISDPVVQDKNDIDRLANEVSKRISKTLYNRSKLGGSPAY